MDLDHFETRCQGTSSGRSPSLDVMFDTAFIQLDGNRVSVTEGNRAWANDRPSTFGGGLQARTAPPGDFAAGFAPGVRQLNAGNGSMCL